MVFEILIFFIAFNKVSLKMGTISLNFCGYEDVSCNKDRTSDPGTADVLFYSAEQKAGSVDYY